MLAFTFGYIADRLRLPPLVGYLVAGILIGPHTPGFVADAGLSAQLAEVGVILLMFGVGLHFSASDLLAVRGIAIPGAIGQIVLRDPSGHRHVLGCGAGASAPASCVGSQPLGGQHRRAAEGAGGAQPRQHVPTAVSPVGWLIVEDLAMVLALVLLPAFAEILGGKPIEGHVQVRSGMPILLELADHPVQGRGLCRPRHV